MKYFGGCDVGSTYTKAVILDENGKQRGVDAERHEKSFQNFCFHIVSSFNYQVMESSNSSSVGSRGSSCITVVM